MHEGNVCDQSPSPRQTKKERQASAMLFSCLRAECEQECIDMFFLHHIPSAELGHGRNQPSNKPREDIEITGERFERKRIFRMELDLPFSEGQAFVAVHFYGASIALGNLFELSSNGLQEFLVLAGFFKELLLN